MKFFIAFILTALLSFAGCLFFPWWTIAIAAFVVSAIIQQGALASFASGFLALFFLWAFQASYIDIKNNHLLSTKVARILPLGGSYIAIILLSAIVGGTVAGFAALTGSFLRKR